MGSLRASPKLGSVLDRMPVGARRLSLAVWRKLVYPAGLQKPLDMIARTATVELDGVRFIPDDIHSLYSILSPSFERWVWNYLNPKPGETFVDIGAHIGRYSLLVSKMICPEGLVIALEPNPTTFYFLAKNVKLNAMSNVVALRVAAWDVEGTLNLSRGIGSGETIVRRGQFTELNVPAAPLDHILGRLGITKVDWIKIDVEGTAGRVLGGMELTLERMKPKLLVEVHNGTSEMLEVFDFMREVSYSARAVEAASPTSRSSHVFFERK